MTEKLYYQNPRQFEFEAQLVHQEKIGDLYSIILNRTCFYPEGGGQPADHGWLNDSPVVDVRKQGDEVVHFTEKPLSGKTVVGKVDKQRRWDFMQQHTGQHILSQCLVRTGEYPTVSVHFGEDITTIEINASDISERDFRAVEDLANRVISQNLPIRTYWIKPEEISKYEFRRPPPRVDQIRVVEIVGFDLTACGGTHLTHTGEVGVIKLVGREKIRGRVRLKAKIGLRAFTDYDRKNRIVRELQKQLTCDEQEIISRIGDFQKQLRLSKREIGKLQQQLMAFRAQEELEKAAQIGDLTFVYSVFEEANNAMLRAFVDEVVSGKNRLAVAISLDGNNLQWVIGQSAGSSIDLRKIVLPLLGLLGAKGGGSPEFMLGGGSNPGGISEFINKLKEKIEQERQL